MGAEPGPYIVGEEMDAKSLFLSIADYHGVRPQVAALLREIGDMRPDRHRIGLGLGQTLLEARQRNEMTIIQVHSRSGISRSQLSFYEQGYQKNPGVRTIQALAYGYRLPFIVVLLAALQDIRPRAKIRNRRRPDGPHQ